MPELYILLFPTPANAMLTWYLTPQPQRSIGTRGHTPWLPRMPIKSHHTESALDLVSSQYLKRHNGCIFHQVTHDLAVEDLQTTIITGVRKQGQTALVEANSSDSLLVETQSLVWLVGELEIVPEKSFITV
jgi:hypothetical protein